MKKIIIAILGIMLNVSLGMAQVGIGVETVRDGGLLDFPNSSTKGIILPKVTFSNVTVEEPGAMLVDPEQRKVLYYSDKQGEEGWKPLTNESTVVIEKDINAYTDVQGQGQGAIITDDESNLTGDSKGVLELISNDKALILPTVETIDDLPTGEPGIICYVKENKVFAIFNGSQWSFWR